MAHNRFNGKQAECRICGFLWDATWEEAEKIDCQRCEKIWDKYPDLAAWVLKVVNTKQEKHTSDYRHDYYDCD